MSLRPLYTPYVQPAKEAAKAVALVVPDGATVIAQFRSADDAKDSTGPSINLPVGTTQEQLRMLINQCITNFSRCRPFIVS
ncbi:hypothetical protein HK101_000448 [Irineochytrium annulatum]|nr:hypothetical protein HK101_000448 [Irineochytrium annulatum]